MIDDPQQDALVVLDDGWTQVGRDLIRRTVELFEETSFYSFDNVPATGKDVGMRIPGKTFGASLSPWVFYVHPIRGGVDVQCCALLPDRESTMLFGVIIAQEGDVREVRAYHNGHGPFTQYGLEI